MGTLKPQSNGDWYTGRWWVRCYIRYSEEEPGRAAAPSTPLLAVVYQMNIFIHHKR